MLRERVWFSCLLRRPARKWSGSIFTTTEPAQREFSTESPSGIAGMRSLQAGRPSCHATDSVKDLHVGYSWAVLCCQASQRVCIKQPSLAQSMLQDSQSESEERVDDGQVPRDSKVVQLKTQLPFIKSQLTVTARYVSLVYLEGWNWTALFR